MSRFPAVVVLCLVAAYAVTTSAFDRPEDSVDGVRVSFPDLYPDWECPVRPADGLLEFRVSVSNGNERTLRGALRTFMNGDWRVDGGPVDVSLAPGASRDYSFVARADLDKVEDAHYQIRAEFRADTLSRPLDAVAVQKFGNSPRKRWKRTRECWEWYAPDGNGNLPELWKRIGAEHPKRARIFDARLGDGFSVSVSTGEQGLTDGLIEFVNGSRRLAYDGFAVVVAGKPLGAAQDGLRFSKVEAKRVKDGCEILHYLDSQGGMPSVVRASLAIKGGTLVLKWDMPGTVRGPEGDPRFTYLHVGSGSESVERAYWGMGDVVVHPRRLVQRADATALSTRHVGMDYPCGISIVQATDVFPDYFVVSDNGRSCHLVAHHDATFTFAPSLKGAFDAARKFAQVSGYRRSPGYDVLADEICLDCWYTGVENATEALGRYAEYGVTNAIFLIHEWSKYGFDTRYPDVNPPRKGEKFVALADMAHKHGMRFGVHDNYIDFYADAAGFDYDHIMYSSGGKPHTAWCKPETHGQSYKFNPDHVRPFLERNMKGMRDIFGADALFVDVLTAMQPLDYYDRSGRFFSRADCAEKWGRIFDDARTFLGVPDAPMVSEGGHDALIGHVDAGQADHHVVKRGKQADFDEALRVPWHDIVTHGMMVLMGGGLEERYAGRSREAVVAHGYGSDDYLETTAIGGRMPHCYGGVFRRASVLTDWMLRGWWRSVARCDMTGLEFSGGDIHRRTATFANGAVIRSNRDSNTVWRVDGVELPYCGFYAKGPGVECGVVMKDGQRVGYSRAGDVRFYDARPLCDADDGREVIETQVTGFRQVSPTKIAVTTEWKVLRKPTAGQNYFVQILNKGCKKEGPILGGGQLSYPKERVYSVGAEFEGVIDYHLDEKLPVGEYDIRYGLYRGHYRTPMKGVNDANTRILGGSFKVVERDGRKVIDGWAPPVTSHEREVVLARSVGANVDGKIIDFGEVRTDGAFRVEKTDRALLVTPLPFCRAFRARFDLAEFGFAGRTVRRIEPIGGLVNPKAPEMKQVGEDLGLKIFPGAQAWRILVE